MYMLDDDELQYSTVNICVFEGLAGRTAIGLDYLLA